MSDLGHKESKISIFCFYDTESQTFDVPNFHKTELHAKRHFAFVFRKNDQNPLFPIRKSFDLYYIGCFDPNNGNLYLGKSDSDTLPVLVAKGLTFFKEDQ